MKKNLKGNVITGDEKLFLQFELGKKKHGIERLFLEDSMSVNGSQISKENNMKIEYDIEDDYNEEIIKGDSAARIGTTLANFMNSTDKIYPILNRYLNLVQEFDENKIIELHTNIEAIINEFKLKELKTDYNINEALLEIHQIISSKDDEELVSCKQLIQEYSKDKKADKEIFVLLNFIDKIFQLKNANYNYYSYSNLIWITAEILHADENIVQQDYNFLLLNLIKKLENKLEVKVNVALKELIHQIFKIFYNDYYFASDPNKLFEFLTNSKNNMINNPYNKYYLNIYEYISSIENKKSGNVAERFLEFSLQEMTKIFIKTLLEDINCISNNYNNAPDTISNVITVSKKVFKYPISSFYELYYISRYYILLDGNTLTMCNLCGRYFITQGKITEQNCRRIYEENLTCSKYARFNNRKGNSSVSQISKEKNRIRVMLKKRDIQNNTHELSEFENKLEDKKRNIYSEEISLEKQNMKLLDWLKTEHEQLKKYN